MGVTKLFDGLDGRLSMLLCGGLFFAACAGGEVIGEADAEGDVDGCTTQGLKLKNWLHKSGSRI